MFQGIDGVELVKLARLHDQRGYFEEVYHSGRTDLSCMQVNHSFSKRGVFRGIHYAPFKKHVTCLHGQILDVIVDLRLGSPTYLQHRSVLLCENWQIQIPEYFGHAFLAVQDSIVIYSQNAHYQKGHEQDIRYDDPDINLILPVSSLILSDKDRDAPFLKEIEGKLHETQNVLSLDVSFDPPKEIFVSSK